MFAGMGARQPSSKDKKSFDGVVPAPPLSPQPTKAKENRRGSSFRMGAFAMEDDSGSPIEKLTNTMIGQKEAGMTGKRVFDKFPSYMSGIIPREEFQKVLVGLKTAECNILWTVKEMGEVVDELSISPEVPFDGEENEAQSGVSSQKLCDFVFTINYLGWKAEKSREKYVKGTTLFDFFKSEVAELVAEVKIEEVLEVAEKVALYEEEPQLVGSVSKLFWKVNVTVEVHCYSNGLVLSFIPFNTATHKEIKRLHFDAVKVREARGAALRPVEVIVAKLSPTQTPSATLGQEVGGSPTGRVEGGALVEEGSPVKAEIKEEYKDMEFIWSKMEVSKATTRQDAGVFVKRMSQDKVDPGDWLLQDVPSSYGMDRVGAGLVRSEKSGMGDFAKMQAELDAEALETKRVRREASRKQRIVQMSLDALEALKSGGEHVATGTISQERWWKAYDNVMMKLTWAKLCKRVDEMDWSKYGYAEVV